VCSCLLIHQMVSSDLPYSDIIDFAEYKERMFTMNRIVIIFVMIFLLICLLAGNILASEEDKILSAIEKRLKEIQTLKVDFEQEVSSGVFATIDKSSGKIYLAANDRFRVETDEQEIVSDSILLWVYSVENKQVKIDSVHKIDDLVRPSEYVFSFKEGYQADLLVDRECDFGDCYKIVLKSPEEDNFIKEMLLLIDSESFLTRKAEYKDINGNLVTISFKNYKIDKKIPNEIFQFKTPKGVDEIRLP
jgi:outer membrane lipoprotein carrier protein